MYGPELYLAVPLDFVLLPPNVLAPLGSDRQDLRGKLILHAKFIKEVPETAPNHQVAVVFSLNRLHPSREEKSPGIQNVSNFIPIFTHLLFPSHL